MISHSFLGTNDLDRAIAFYTPLLDLLGWRPRFRDEAKAAWSPKVGGRPLFAVGHAYDGAPAMPGNGPMVALLAASRALVDKSYALAMSLQARSEGAPGLRPHYHPDYYGAYFRDPDGNKLCVCCHDKA